MRSVAPEGERDARPNVRRADERAQLRLRSHSEEWLSQPCVVLLPPAFQSRSTTLRVVCVIKYIKDHIYFSFSFSRSSGV